MQRKTNEEILGIVKGKRTFMNFIRARSLKMVEHALRTETLSGVT